MTKEQEKFINENYQQMSALELAKKLGLKRRCVYMYCYNRGVRASRQRNKSYGSTKIDWEKDGMFCIESYALNII